MSSDQDCDSRGPVPVPGDRTARARTCPHTHRRTTRPPHTHTRTHKHLTATLAPVPTTRRGSTHFGLDDIRSAPPYLPGTRACRLPVWQLRNRGTGLRQVLSSRLSRLLRRPCRRFPGRPWGPRPPSPLRGPEPIPSLRSPHLDPSQPVGVVESDDAEPPLERTPTTTCGPETRGHLKAGPVPSFPSDVRRGPRNRPSTLPALSGRPHRVRPVSRPSVREAPGWGPTGTWGRTEERGDTRVLNGAPPALRGW